MFYRCGILKNDQTFEERAMDITPLAVGVLIEWDKVDRRIKKIEQSMK